MLQLVPLHLSGQGHVDVRSGHVHVSLVGLPVLQLTRGRRHALVLRKQHLLHLADGGQLLLAMLPLLRRQVLVRHLDTLQ